MKKLVPSTTACGRVCGVFIQSWAYSNKMHTCVGKSALFFLMKGSIPLSCWCGKQLKLQPAGCELSNSGEKREAALTFLCPKSVSLPSKVCRLMYYCTFIWSFSWLCTQPGNSLAHKPPCKTINLVKCLLYTSFFSAQILPWNRQISIDKGIRGSSTWQQLISNRPWCLFIILIENLIVRL